MCGRFALTLPQEAVIDMFRAAPAPGAEEALAAIDRPRWNIRPTEAVAVIALEGGARELRPMRWGFLPAWSKSLNEGPPLINARAETIAEKPAFRAACRERRCLIAADGFYEWRADARPGEAPYWIRPVSGAPLVLAGVWTRWRAPKGLGVAAGAESVVDSVAIVTCAASGPLAQIHHRIPVAIPAEAWGLWLGEEGAGAARLMRAADHGFYAYHRVSSAINIGGRGAPDGPELLAPCEETEEDEAALGRLI